MRDVIVGALLLTAVTCPKCERPTEVELQVNTDSPVDLSLSCPHVHAVDRLGKTPYGPFHAHLGDTLLFTDEDAGFYYAESVASGTPGGPPEVLDREFNLPGSASPRAVGASVPAREPAPLGFTGSKR